MKKIEHIKIISPKVNKQSRIKRLGRYNSVIVVGAGLAGSEAAWQAAEAGIDVTLLEMRPIKKSPAHHTSEFGELVCSNSFGALSSDRAAGLLQAELRALNSLVLNIADTFAVPAGGALAVDRSQFSKALTNKISSHPLIQIVQALHNLLEFHCIPMPLHSLRIIHLLFQHEWAIGG